jgi:2-succinyl-6-hydroxy-2,4-cyclohexadiene-1-carboxylate synthase
VIAEAGIASRAIDVEVGGVRLRVVDEGSGEPVLVLHGFTGAAESMEAVSKGLRDRYRVVRLELIGHGGSESPFDRARYAMDACAAQIAEVVRLLDLGHPHVLGYSMGGRAAIAAAVAEPQMFRSLVLVGATAGLEDPALRRERIDADEGLADRIERDGLASFVDAWMALPLFASQARLGEAALSRARAQRMRNDVRGLSSSLRGMGAGAQAPLHDRLVEIEAPVLLVVGGEDEKFRGIATSLESRFVNARTHVLAGAGHAAHLESPEAFADIVAAFFEEASVRRTNAVSPASPRSAENLGGGA